MMILVPGFRGSTRLKEGIDGCEVVAVDTRLEKQVGGAIEMSVIVAVERSGADKNYATQEANTSIHTVSFFCQSVSGLITSYKRNSPKMKGDQAE